MRTEFTDTYGVDLSDPVAVSELKRSPRTAQVVGFHNLVTYPELNEVEHGMDLLDLRTSLDNGIIPDAAKIQAEIILNKPPEEDIWITHGLVIGGLCWHLGLYQTERVVPKLCEIRVLPI